MMAALNAADAAKLAKLLGMLGSDHAGERDAAGLAAHRMIRQRGLGWEQIISVPNVMPATLSAPASSPSGKWQRAITECLARPGSLRRWESDFLTSLRHHRQISRKQREVLVGIAERVLGAGTMA